jgi:hypothetical protein
MSLQFASILSCEQLMIVHITQRDRDWMKEDMDYKIIQLVHLQLLHLYLNGFRVAKVLSEVIAAPL